MMGIVTGNCTRCDEVLVADGEANLAAVVAVHLHDEHPDEFERYAESARKLNELGDEVLE